MSTPLFDTGTYPVQYVLDTLLMDRSTGRNIIFATDSYAEQGELYTARRHIVKDMFTGSRGNFIQPRVLKALEEQVQRTRKKAEVFTPAWVCCLMNDYIDEEWFFRKDVFFHLEGQQWTATEGKIALPTRRHKRWQQYVDSRRLEITCGEAPYLVSRYDMATGEVLPIARRVGILDRKLRIVNENTETEADWWEWTLRAFHSVYGYEYQGDSLLIARINLLLTFADSVRERWNREPKEEEVEEIAKVISWNLWQMDGLSGTVPVGALGEPEVQTALWLMETGQERTKCKVKNWRQNANSDFQAFREGGVKGMKFDYIIGNPPYQDETESNTTRKPPIYNSFMDETYFIGNAVELITPARFLYNAGQTPKAWNQKMLDDQHLKVLYYEPDASKVFPNTDIKGGVVVTFRDSQKDYGPIRAFVPFAELRTILEKAGAKGIEDSLTDIADSSNVYHLKNIYADHPDYRKYVGDGGRHSQLKTNVLNINPIFTDSPTDIDDYSIFGLVNGKRGKKYCHRRYIKSEHKSLHKYKVLVPKATGSGKFGDSLPEMIVVEPEVAFTQTYISIGTFDNLAEAKNLSKYLKTKFCRALLYVLKVTQDNLPGVWRFIPKQDFADNSDIDWTKSISDIDRQLYKKYRLTQEEIDFIETHVKEME